MPKVSIIVPIYNCQDYLQQCLSSLKAQQLEEIEVLMVDDASPDQSLTIAERFAQQDSRFRCIKLSQNMGVSEARNMAILQARGEYLGFVDGDDYVSEAMFAELYSMAKQGNHPVVACQMARFEDQHTPQQMNLQSAYLDTFVTNKLFKRDWWLANHLSFYRGMIFEDEPLVYIARFLADELPSSQQVHYYYRLNPQGQCRAPERQRYNLHEKQLMLCRWFTELSARRMISAHREELLQNLCHHALSALYYPLSGSDQIAFWHFIDHLISKYHLQERDSYEHDYHISRFLRYHQQPGKILALQQFVALKNRTEKLKNQFRSSSLATHIQISGAQA